MSAVEISELSPAGEPAAAGHRPRTWAYVGVVAGLAGVIGIQASGFIDAAYAEGVAVTRWRSRTAWPTSAPPSS